MTAQARLHDPISGQTRILLWAAAVGCVAGFAAVLFRLAATRLPYLLWPGSTNLVHAVAMAPAWQRLLVPTAGSLLAGLVLILGSRWPGALRGWDILEAVVLRDGILHVRPALVKCGSSLITVASAGAVGREGPMVLLSASVSSLLGRRFGIPTRHLRILVGCGVAAGIACAYNTPIGAALFTMEIIVGNFAMDVFAPLVFASVIATLLSRAAFSSAPVFNVPALTMVSLWEILPYTLLGLLGGLTAALFLQGLRFSSFLFRRSRLPRPISMALVGLALGITTLWFPEVVGNGREAITDLFLQEWSIPLALTLFGLRLLVTTAMVGSGAVGGVFTPTLFLGAVLGEAFGSIVHSLSPALIASPKAYALVGMGALLAGTTHAPLTAVLMLFEMTLDYNIVLPLLLASAASSLIARRVMRDSVYTEALRRKRGAGEAGEAAVMRKLTVRDVMRSEQLTLPADLSLPQILDRFIAARRNHMYVVDGAGSFLGTVGLHDVNRALREYDDPARITAKDIVNPHFEVTTPWEHLDRVLERFWVEEAERLPVVDNRHSRKLLGTISQRDILGVYSVEILNRRSLLARFDTAETHGPSPTYIELPIDHEVEEIPVPGFLVGQSVGAAHFRERYGVSVLLIRRRGSDGKDHRLIPEGSTAFEAHDRLIVFGPREKLADLRNMQFQG